MGKIWQFPRNEAGKVLGWSDDSSPSNPNAALALVNRSLSEGPVDFRTYATLAEAAGSNIPPVIDEVEILNYAMVGDGGGARYMRVETEPNHGGKFQSANGAWWELVNQIVTPSMFGAVGNGTADDTTAVTNAISIGRQLDWGNAAKSYRITANITLIPARDVVWTASGATILLDSPASIQSAIVLNCAGRSVTITGSLMLDCQQKSFIGFFFQNSSTTTYGDFFASNLKVRNVYRASTTFTGGHGIWVRGGWRNVYLERPDVRNVLMASGAGVSGSQGISGISVTAMTLAPQEVTIVHPYVDGVYSEDAAYFVDQDGIQVFGPEDDGTTVPTSSHFSLIGGKIMNCGGRGVKSQMEFGHINGTHFVRDSSGISALARVGTMPEIDFQVGGGIIENIECKYAGSSPHRIVQLTGSRQATPIRTVASAKVDGIRISRNGASPLANLVSVAPYYMRGGIIDIKNITHADLGLLSDNAIQINDQADNSAPLIINLENIHARVNPAGPFVFAKCNRTVGTTHFVGRNIYATQTSTDFVLASAGTVTETLEGKNINVT